LYGGYVKVPTVALLLFTIAFIFAPEVCAAEKGSYFAVAAGLARSDADNVDGLSWTFAGSVDWLLSEKRMTWARTMLGLAGLDSDDAGNGNCSFVKADFMYGSFLAASAGIGLYHLHTPFSSTEYRTVEWGINGGLRFGLPYHDEHLIFTELTAHRIFADEPSVLVTLTAGFTWP
jgi:hypothetical protein